ncbi:MAG: LacI family DNA-binding transcriptional regulator [Christensenellales bacterium]|nr:LacI family transcriptional regulator [Clostridiales bacterium]
MPATIRDVAKKAGVAPSTVSKALNSTGAVSQETLLKVKQAAHVLGYRPNARARNFATRATYQMAFLADFPFDAAFVNPHLFEIMRGVQHTLNKKGYAMVMKHISSRDALSYVEQAWTQRMVDGFVLHMSVLTKRLSAYIGRESIPHIVIGKPDFDNRLCWIDTDHCLSGRLAVRYLAELGYREYCFVGGRADDMTSWRRLHGVRQELKEMGLNLPRERVLQSQSTLADGARAMKKLLRMNPRPQAVICANNPIAFGLMHALQARGFHIPEDIALITFDSYPFSMLTDPPMTVVDINMYEIGQEAGRLVLQKLRHPATQIQTYITTPTLVCRGTTPVVAE